MLAAADPTRARFHHRSDGDQSPLHRTTARAKISSEAERGP